MRMKQKQMKKKTGNPHNNFFIEQFTRTEVASSFFKEYLPTLVSEEIVWGSLQLVPGDFVQKALNNRKSDILYQCKVGKSSCFLYLHLEHQRTPSADMPYRMLVYMVNIWQQFEKQSPDEKIPVVLPIVLYQGTTPWNPSTKFHDFINPPDSLKAHVPDFEFRMIDLSHLEDDQIKGELILQIGLLTMKHIDNPLLTDFLFKKLTPMFFALDEKKTGLEYLETILYYLSQGSDKLDKDYVIQNLKNYSGPKTFKEVFMTLAEQWTQEGILKGIEEGMLKGIEEGMLKGVEKGMLKGVEKGMLKGKLEGEFLLIWKLLKQKFGKNAKSIKAQLEQCTPEELELVAEKILTSNTIEDLFIEL